MFKSVMVTNHLNESLKLDLFNPEPFGLLVSKISGIGAPDATINTVDYAISDGGHFTSARAGKRTITITILPFYWEGRSVETARQLTYRYFPLRHKVRLEFETDNHTLAIEGWVKKNEPDIFQKKESITITIECPQPWFYLAHGDTTVVFSGIEPAFEFPWKNNKTENDTITIHHKEYDDFGRVIREWDEIIELENTTGLLVMGEIKKEKSKTITYNGEIEVGFVCTIQAMKDGVRNILIWKQETSEFIRIETDKIQQSTGTSFQKGDIIEISTVSGDRYIKIRRGNGETNIINALDLNSTWIQLTSGVNTFWYAADEDEDNMEFKISYKTAYQGV